MYVHIHTLQVGLAVDDIKGVREKAALKKEALQVYNALMIFYVFTVVTNNYQFIFRLNSF